MSAICGLLLRRETGDASDSLERMLTALAHRGIDGSRGWSRATVALGHQAFHTTPESRLAAQPLSVPGADLTITADARLDNRPELLAALGIAGKDAPAWPDARLILAAYEKWGLACPRRLIGAFAFILWDQRHRRLFCCRDALGLRPLFYARLDDLFAVASEGKALCALQKRVAPNLTAIARLGDPRPKGENAQETYFEGIFGLPPATALVVDAHGEHQETYWRPDPGARLGLKQDDEVLEGLRELLFQVMEPQLRASEPVASLLSGGLDSSSVVAVAARLLQGRAATLTTLSSVAMNPEPSGLPETSGVGRVRDEGAYIGEFADWPNIRQRPIAPVGAGPLDDIERLVHAFESPTISTRHYLYAAFSKSVRELGIRVILDGCGGELGPTYRADGLYSEWLLRGDWRRLWRELQLGAQRRGTSPWTFLRAQLLRPLVPAPLLRLRAGDAARRPHALNPAFVTELLGDGTGRHSQASPPAGGRPWSHRNAQAAIIRGHPSRVAGTIGYEHTELRYPLLDRRLLEYCLAAPARLKVRDGYPRYLVRGALDGILPTAIQWRTTKEPFSPDYFLRYNAQRHQAQERLAAIGPKDPVREVVDVERLKTWSRHEMTTSRYDSAANWTGGHWVPRGLYLIAFLRQFPEFRA